MSLNFNVVEIYQIVCLIGWMLQEIRRMKLLMLDKGAIGLLSNEKKQTILLSLKKKCGIK
ncbi:hypothetical protein IW16_24245 [Chryseobacterium vrystaatense]|uniref:Uncharacterized protein n=1 Tax=Chryseobacterium vrystaatense TaxID=307480 RepID=A0ABR4UFU4_9FLAO|nr:hypothetical protein IW16_24245 [Chryseobacterium vrystaatense]